MMEDREHLEESEIRAAGVEVVGFVVEEVAFVYCCEGEWRDCG